MNYIRTVQEFYWKTLEQNSLTDSASAEKFEQALILLDLEEQDANLQIQNDMNLKQMFGFNTQYLNIIEESSNDSSQEDNEETLINQESSSSEEERTETLRMNQVPPKNESGTSSETKNQNPPNVAGHKRKADFYPPATEFKINQSAFGSNTLYLDFQTDRKKLIDIWAKEISLIIQTNPSQYDDQNTVLLLLDHKTAGVVNKFIKETTWSPLLSPVTTFNTVLDSIYAVFLGIDYVRSKNLELNKIKEEAKIKLSKMQLCDICHIEQFYCDYERHLFNTGNQEGYESYIKEYMRKIPLIGEKALTRFMDEKSDATSYSLAFAQRIVKEEIAKICDLTRKQKQLKLFSKKCCKQITEENLTYGCTPQYKDKKKKKYFKKTSKYRFRKKKKSFKPGKFVRKKDSFNKQKFCPKGKKNCRCWVCNEEGHYANECPNRKQNSNKVKILEEILSLGLAPIEDEYEGTQEVLIIEIDPGDIPSESEEEDESSSESN